jgi:hypothetical protein
MFFEKKKTKVIALLIVVAMVVTMMSSVFAQEPFVSYGYDWWWETYPVQSGYIIDRVVTSNELELAIPLRGPKDVHIYRDDVIDETFVFIVDTGNNRLVLSDENFENVRIMDEFYYHDDYMVQNFMTAASRYCDSQNCRHVCDEENRECYNDKGDYICRYFCGYKAFWEEVDRIGTKTTLRNPHGVHVVREGGRDGEILLYIADHDNERILKTKLDGGILMEYRRPVTATYSAETSFAPSKVIVDNAGNVYVAIKAITRGAVKFNARGDFVGYYGANRVTRTADAILNYFLRFILTREQMLGRIGNAPVEFSNFTIDNDQFIYTVTASRSANVDIVTKLDPAGRNVFAQQGYDSMVWGDFNQPYIYGEVFMSQMIDISISDNGDIHLFDSQSGKIFQYDKEGHLMFIFGGKGEQKGLFVRPEALETYDNKVYALDSTKNSITVFRLTEFGGLVLEAMALFNRGLYAESMEPWYEVLKRDANYYMAYVGMGNAKLSVGEFAEALDYFYMHSRGGYGRAFKDFRITYIRDNFDKMLAAALIAVGLMVAGDALLKIRRKKKQDLALYNQYN